MPCEEKRDGSLNWTGLWRVRLSDSGSVLSSCKKSTCFHNVTVRANNSSPVVGPLTFKFTTITPSVHSNLRTIFIAECSNENEILMNINDLI